VHKKSACATVAATLGAAAFLACAKDPVELACEPVERNDAPRLTLSADSVVVSLGDRSLLFATIRNATGRAQYVSRDPGVVTVTSNGAIRAVGTGSTYVAATLPDRPHARDSVRVRVHALAITGDSCPASRPTFGVATEADRAPFAYDASAPLNLQTRIGSWRYSYGGILGAGFVGIERRLEAAVLVAAMGGIVTGATMPGKLASVAARSCATRAVWFQAMVPIEPIRFISHNSATAMLFLAGRFDDAVLPADARTPYDAATAPEELRWYGSGHSLPDAASLDTQDWLHTQTGIDPRAGS
jgi:hypothetical protein